MSIKDILTVAVSQKKIPLVWPRFREGDIVRIDDFECTYNDGTKLPALVGEYCLERVYEDTAYLKDHPGRQVMHSRMQLLRRPIQVGDILMTGEGRVLDPIDADDLRAIGRSGIPLDIVHAYGVEIQRGLWRPDPPIVVRQVEGKPPVAESHRRAKGPLDIIFDIAYGPQQPCSHAFEWNDRLGVRGGFECKGDCKIFIPVSAFAKVANPYDSHRNMLADANQIIQDENKVLLVENAKLRREIEALKRKKK